MSFLSHRSIFLVDFTFHLVEWFIECLQMVEPRKPEKIRLREEINQILREANSLSTPSTFAQAAKLRRQAAAKEKELHKCMEEPDNNNIWLSVLSKRNLFVVKVMLWIWLSWEFWGVPVAVIPQQLLEPFGSMLSWNTVDVSACLLPVGIMPWLIMSSGVSKVLCQKFSKFLHLLEIYC